MDINRVNPKALEKLKAQNSQILAPSKTTNFEPTKPVVDQSPVKNKKALEDEVFYNFLQENLQLEDKKLKTKKKDLLGYSYYLTREHYLAGFEQQVLNTHFPYKKIDLTTHYLFEKYKVYEIPPTYRGKIESNEDHLDD